MAVLKFTDSTTTYTVTGPVDGITTDPADNQAEVRLDNRSQLGLLINYTAGDETSLSVLTEFSPLVTLPLPTPPGTPALGTDFYPFSNTDGSGVVTPFPFVVNATGTFRIPIPVFHQERVLRVSVSRTGGTDAGAGSISLRVVDDSHLMTSSLAGYQPS